MSRASVQARHTVAVPRIALVLGAGGTVGHGFHAGVLAALGDVIGWDARRAHLMAGTSAGSMVASLLRAGMPPGDLVRRAGGAALSAEGEAVALRANLGAPGGNAPPRRRPTGRSASPSRLVRALRAPWEVRPGSLAAAALPAGQIPTDAIGAPFGALYGAAWPSSMLWIVAVHLDSGRRVVFGRDTDIAGTSVGDAVRASCAIPAFFQPAEIAGQRYVDGGVHSTTNADLVGAERPDLVLVSAPMSAARGAAKVGLDLPVRQFARLSLAREVAGLRARRIDVMVFQPTVADLELMRGDALDPSKLGPVCDRVVETTTQRLARSDVARRLHALTD